ncbi:MAG: hypothetical protein LR015_01800 [Verrucomicrobia bacterium]|nr:hypothetical protein [Verrucomicrobiota bacterium]
MKKITTLVSCAIVAAATHALAVLPFSGTYLQDFQTLPTSTGAWTNNSTLPGWFSSATTINYRATSGSTSLTNSDLQSVNLGAGDLALVNVNDAVCWCSPTHPASHIQRPS